ncbi:MAG: NADH:ubiquinone oxidoreductase, partial [Candidatus Omnitrophica bacterium]|nr:NADH:ubiquinone oxidoreductase [Candidatus Omnitrophota bacterium]
MGLKEKILTKSLYVFHLSSGSCNNCDIEIIDCLTPRYDIERFGIVLVGSIKHADVLLCTGSANKMTIPR